MNGRDTGAATTQAHPGCGDYGNAPKWAAPHGEWFTHCISAVWLLIIKIKCHRPVIQCTWVTPGVSHHHPIHQLNLAPWESTDPEQAFRRRAVPSIRNWIRSRWPIQAMEWILPCPLQAGPNTKSQVCVGDNRSGNGAGEQLQSGVIRECLPRAGQVLTVDFGVPVFHSLWWKLSPPFPSPSLSWHPLL